MRGTDPFDPSHDRPPSRPAAEQARLDEAMRRADDLLISSLKSDDRRRKHRFRILFLIMGGLVMLAALGFVVVTAMMQGQLVASDAADESGQLTQEGWRLWQGQQFADAAEKFEEAVKLAPKNTSAWNGLGWSLFNGNQGEAAEKAFKQVVALEPKHPAALNGLGQLALMNRKYKEAEKYLLKAAPQAPAAWYGLARLYLLEGKFADAEKWAQKIVASGQADEGAQQLLQAAQEKKLSPELRRMIEPPAPEKRVSSKVTRGWQLMNQGRNAESRELFEEVLADNPADANALNGLGWNLLNSGEAAAARPYFEKAIAADKDSAGSINGLARVLHIEGDREGAVQLWKDMVERFPGPNAGTAGLADAYFARGEFDKAIPLLEQLAEADPANQQFKTRLEQAREKAGQ